MPRQKTCGNCSNFVRISSWGRWRNGLCDWNDYNCHTDFAAGDCKGYRPLVFNQNADRRRLKQKLKSTYI